MRWKDREISDESGIIAIIGKAVVCRLGLVNKVKATAVIRVEIDSMTGKKAGF